MEKIQLTTEQLASMGFSSEKEAQKYFSLMKRLAMPIETKIAS